MRGEGAQGKGRRGRARGPQDQEQATRGGHGQRRAATSARAGREANPSSNRVRDGPQGRPPRVARRLSPSLPPRRRPCSTSWGPSFPPSTRRGNTCSSSSLCFACSSDSPWPEHIPPPPLAPPALPLFPSPPLLLPATRPPSLPRPERPLPAADGRDTGLSEVVKKADTSVLQANEYLGTLIRLGHAVRKREKGVRSPTSLPRFLRTSSLDAPPRFCPGQGLRYYANPDKHRSVKEAQAKAAREARGASKGGGRGWR